MKPIGNMTMGSCDMSIGGKESRKTLFIRYKRVLPSNKF